MKLSPKEFSGALAAVLLLVGFFGIVGAGLAREYELFTLWESEDEIMIVGILFGIWAIVFLWAENYKKKK